jgi:hypothetical protein
MEDFARGMYEIHREGPTNKGRLPAKLFSSREELEQEIRLHGHGTYVVHRLVEDGNSTRFCRYTLHDSGLIEVHEWPDDDDEADD